MCVCVCVSKHVSRRVHTSLYVSEGLCVSVWKCMCVWWEAELLALSQPPLWSPYPQTHPGRAICTLLVPCLHLF